MVYYKCLARMLRCDTGRLLIFAQYSVNKVGRAHLEIPMLELKPIQIGG